MPPVGQGRLCRRHPGGDEVENACTQLQSVGSDYKLVPPLPGDRRDSVTTLFDSKAAGD